jgi:hypothetical protein
VPANPLMAYRRKSYGFLTLRRHFSSGMFIRASASFLDESERNGSASISSLSWLDSLRSNDPPTQGLDGNAPYETELLAFERFFDRIKFLRLGGYPLGAAIIGALRMGKGSRST